MHSHRCIHQKSYLSWIVTQVITLGKRFHCFADGSGKSCSPLANSRGSCSPWMPGSSPRLKNKLHVAAMHTNIRRDNTEHDLSLWLGNVLSRITSTFTQTTSKAFFEKCGLTAREERIRPSVLTHIKAELLGIIRTLTVDELTFYIGKNADALQKLLLATAVPEEFQHAHVHNFLPHQRLSSKRSLHPE